jgi:hypothetical protein
LALGFASVAGLALAEDWPGFRGSRGGVAPPQNLPTSLSKDNVLWKFKMPGVGTSSPIVGGDKIIVTAYAGYGMDISKGMGTGFGGFGKGGFDKGTGGFGKGDFGKGGFGKGGFGKSGPADSEQKKLKLMVVCLDRKHGDIAWKTEVEPKLPEASFTGMLREHGYASSTPVTDGERIYVFFGKSGVYAFDLAGKQLWRADVGTKTHMMGTAASPVVYKDLVIVNASIESDALFGLDKRTGKEQWRARGLGTAWASPILVETKEGKTEVVLNLPGKVAGYDPDTGKELWHCTGIGSASSGGGFGGGGFGAGMGGSSPTPVARDGVVYVTGGGGPLPTATMAVRAGGKGDVTKTHVVWKAKTGAAYCSPVLCGDYLCWVDGMVQCLDIADGKVAHKDRLYSARGEYVSAVAAGSTIIALTRFDGMYLLDAKNKFAELSHHEFDGDATIFNASPAVADGRIYVRSNGYMYCLGKRE